MLPFLLFLDQSMNFNLFLLTQSKENRTKGIWRNGALSKLRSKSFMTAFMRKGFYYLIFINKNTRINIILDQCASWVRRKIFGELNIFFNIMGGYD